MLQTVSGSHSIGTNNLEAGRLGGQFVAAQLNGKGNVVFFTMPGQPNLEERLKGYKDVFANSPGIKIVEVFDMKGQSTVAMDKAVEYLARTGPAKINAYISLESLSAKDVAEAFNKRAKPQDAMVMAMDVDQATLELVKDGTIKATISQKPFTMASVGLKALDDIHHYPLKPLARDDGSDAQSPILALLSISGVSRVDQTNVDKFLTPGSKNTQEPIPPRGETGYRGAAPRKRLPVFPFRGMTHVKKTVYSLVCLAGEIGRGDYGLRIRKRKTGADGQAWTGHLCKLQNRPPTRGNNEFQRLFLETESHRSLD